MANNTLLNAGTGGDTIATEDISGVKHELVKLEFGADGVATKVSATDPLPVDTGLTQPTTPSDTQPVSAASLPLPTGAANQTKQDTGNTSLSSIDTKLSSQATASKQDIGNTSLASIDTKLTNPLPVSGTVTINTIPAGNNNIGDVDIASIAAGDNNIGNVDVLTLPSLPAGTNAIGKLAANDGVDIGDVTINNASGSPVEVNLRSSTLSVATSTKQSDGSQKSQIVDGSGNVIGATSNALDINIKSGNPTTIAVTQGTATSLKTQAESYQGGSAVGSGNPLEVNIRSSTVAIDCKDKPDASSTYALTNVSSSAYETNHVLKSSAGYLFMLTGYNSKTSGQFIQLHNATSLPSDTAVPVLIFYVSAGANFSLDLSKYGRYFSTGIVVCNSSTGPTKTIGSADCWFDAQII